MKLKKTVVCIMVTMFLASLAFAAEKGPEKRGTKAEAEAMVKKAIEYIKANGRDKAFAEFSNPSGKFVDKDLYVFVYDLNGKCLAHGANAKMVGKDLINMKDPEGKEYVKERISIAKNQGKGWQDYKFPNPVTKQIEHKTAYIEKFEDIIVGCGVYKS
ncbi:MAG TPA: cache domain-containing protein [Thermodesulfovibrionales bacterium]|nr:cache domain-containing protein [Thermodesulfovibrionales bacterium]